MFNPTENIKPYKTLISNFTYLSILQFINYLFPLVTLPYLVRILGPEKYGLVNFAMAFVAYFTTICDYGFNLSATRQISISRSDQLKINELFSSVLSSKILLGIISIIILIIITNSFTKFSANTDIYLLSFGVVIGNILFPVWFYQGIENMKPITIITFISRFIGTVMIFILINDAGDYPKLIIIYSLSAILIGITGLLLAMKKFGVTIVIPNLSDVKYQFTEGFQIFISMIAINLYTTTNIFLLGIFVNDTAVGYFSAADKIRSAAQNIIPTISQTVFPHINKLLSESADKFISFIKILLKYQTIVSFFISLGLLVFSKEIVELLLGVQFQQSILVLKILSVLPLLSSFTTIFAVNVLIPLDQKKYFMNTFLTAGIISLITTLICTPLFTQNGTALALVAAEISTAVISFLFVKIKLKIF